MATAAQTAANQANAQHSTGPRTPEGKARVAQNAVKHGLAGRDLVIRPYQQEEFEALRESLEAELQPQGAVETVTFHELLHAAWSLHRFRAIEAEISLGTVQDFTDPQTTAVIDRLTRYQARAQRAYYRALAELRTLQTNRALRAVKLDEEAEAETPAIADINEMTKQTRSEVTAEALKQAINMINYETGIFQLKALHNRIAPGSAAGRQENPSNGANCDRAAASAL
jgi:hypothetical protein